MYHLVEANGFRFPSKRRAYVRSPAGKPIHDLLLISIDTRDYHVEKRENKLSCQSVFELPLGRRTSDPMRGAAACGQHPPPRR